jgi:prepilin-type N-terminal cleavage/methylation domain-containing protein
MKNAGFTLVEVLVALVVGGLLLAALTSVVGGLAQDLKKTEAVNGLAELQAVTPTLRKLIENAIPTDEPNSIEPDELELTVPPPQALGPIGPLKMELMVRRSGKGEGLFAAFDSAASHADLPAAVRQRQLLVDGFSSISIDAQNAASTPANRLPRLIRITFANRGEDPVILTFQPRISATGACRFDTISMNCRA